MAEGRYEQERGVRRNERNRRNHGNDKRGRRRIFCKGTRKQGRGRALSEHIIEERGMKKKDIVRKLNLEESYARKLFGGQRIPTRKILLQCAFLLSLDLSDTQRLLDIGQKPRLYPRVRYDAAIIYGLEEKMTLEEMNSFLDEIGEEILL